MRRIAFLWMLMFAVASGQEPKRPEVTAPPTHWYSDPAEDLLAGPKFHFTKDHPTLAAKAKELAARYAARIDQLRETPEISKLAAQRAELRKLGNMKDHREKWNAWFERNRELYAPVDAVVREFQQELDKLAASDKGPAPKEPVAVAEPKTEWRFTFPPQGPPDIERFLQIRSAGSPTISADGKTVAYLTNVTGSAQVWAVPIEGGAPSQWTFHRDRVTLVKFSPTDNNLLVIGRDTGGNERTQLHLLSRGGANTLAIDDDPKAIQHFGCFSHDGKQIAYSSNARDSRFFDIYIYDLEKRAARRVYKNDGNNSVVAFGPPSPIPHEGGSLLLRRVNTPSDVELLLLSLLSGRAVDITPHRPARYDDVHWGADGNSLILRTDAGSEFSRVVTVKLDNMLPAGVESRHEVEHLSVHSAIGHSWTISSSNIGGWSTLHGRAKEIVPPFRGVVSSIGTSAATPHVAVTFGSATHPNDIWIVSPLFDGFNRRLTHSDMAGFTPDDLVEPQTVTFKSFDGLEIPAFLYLPKNAKKDGTLPAVVEIHGGPESQRRPVFSPVTQYLVARGYAVLEPNVRGSSGYGKTYEHLDDVRKRMDSVKDIKAAVEWLTAGGYVDKSKIACMGGSYGGFMVLACVTEYPDLWAAGVDFVGIANFESFLENTGAYRRKLREAEYGSLENDREFLRSISPIHKADRITAPLMVVQGANDPRVPQGESDQIVAGLRKRNRTVEYLLFPDEGHGIAKLPNRLKAYRAVADFLDKHVARTAAK